MLCSEKFEKEAAEMNKRSFKYAWGASSCHLHVGSQAGTVHRLSIFFVGGALACMPDSAPMFTGSWRYASHDLCDKQVCA